MNKKTSAYLSFRGCASREHCMDLMRGFANSKNRENCKSSFQEVEKDEYLLDLLGEEETMYCLTNPRNGYPIPDTTLYLHIIGEGCVPEEVKEDIRLTDRERKYPNATHIFVKLPKDEYDELHSEAMSFPLEPLVVIKVIRLGEAETKSLQKREMRGLMEYAHKNEVSGEEYHLCYESYWNECKSGVLSCEGIIQDCQDGEPGLTIHYIHLISEGEVNRILAKKR